MRTTAFLPMLTFPSFKASFIALSANMHTT
jgi:hypothetical protein